jgi:hypothetical protein
MQGGLRRNVAGPLSQLAGIALIASAVALFLAGAIAGLTLIGRLGTAGWIMWVSVVVPYALVFGPVVASGVSLHQHGSRRHQEAVEKRAAEQRAKFALDLYGTHAAGRGAPRAH